LELFRALMLVERKKDQEEKLEELEREQHVLMEKGEEIVRKCGDVQKSQMRLMERLKHILRELQTNGSILSDAERKFGEELDEMNDRLPQLQAQMKTINGKMKYRCQSMEEEPEVELSSSQNNRIRRILKDQSEMISTTTNELKRLQKESGL
jgi:ABC-type phosphate transport system auxiliary subunit